MWAVSRGQAMLTTEIYTSYDSLMFMVHESQIISHSTFVSWPNQWNNWTLNYSRKYVNCSKHINNNWNEFVCENVLSSFLRVRANECKRQSNKLKVDRFDSSIGYDMHIEYYSECEIVCTQFCCDIQTRVCHTIFFITTYMYYRMRMKIERIGSIFRHFPRFRHQKVFPNFKEKDPQSFFLFSPSLIKMVRREMENVENKINLYKMMNVSILSSCE